MMLRALLTIGAMQVLTMLVLLVRTKTLAVVLGPELVGVMAVIDKLLAVIAQTVSLSLPFAAVRFLPGRWSAGPSEYRALFVRMRNLVLALILAATVGALLVSLFHPIAWGEALLPYRDAVTVAIFTLPVVGLMPFLQNAVAGRMEQNRSMLVGFLHAIVMALAIVGVVWNGLSGYYAVYAVAGILLAAGVTRLATRGTAAPAPQPSPAARFPFGLPAPVWRFSGALLILAFLTPYAALFIHYRLLSDHGAQPAGWMQAAIGISLAARAVLGSAHAVFLTPNVNRGGSPADRMAWANNFQLTFCLIAGVTVPPLLLFPGIAVHILYSQAFLSGAAFVVFFVFAEVVGLLSGTYQSLVIALDHLRFHVASNLAAQLLVVVAAWQLVPPHGILGAGLAALVGPVFLSGATLAFLHRTYRLGMPGAVAARAGWLLASMAGAGAVGACTANAPAEMLPLKAGLYLLALAGFAFLLTEHERERIRQFLRKSRAG